MALINVLKIGSDGLQAEHDPSADSINMLDYQLGGTSLAGTSGSTVLGDDSATYLNITPAGDTIRDALEALDSALDDVDSVVKTTYTNGEASPITIGQAVYISANDTVMLADNDDAAKDDPIGLVADASIGAAAQGEIQSEGVVPGALTGATAGDLYFLDSTPGDLTPTPPTGSGKNVVVMGFAKNATDIHLRIQNIGKRV